MLPPYWAFAPWKARDYHQNEAQVKEDVDKNRELGLPASVILIDSPWTAAYNDYKFNPKQFADAPGDGEVPPRSRATSWCCGTRRGSTPSPIRRTRQGFAGKIVAAARTTTSSPRDQDLFVKNADGSPYVGRWWKGMGSLIDFTNPKAKQWWQDQVRQAIAAGADGFKDDDAEGNFFGRREALPTAPTRA